jgi:hypothetical protein
MHSDSRKAQHNSFAHHRAMLLLSNHLAAKGNRNEWFATLHEGTDPAELQRLKTRVSAGLLGFVPAAPAGAL